MLFVSNVVGYVGQRSIRNVGEIKLQLRWIPDYRWSQ